MAKTKKSKTLKQLSAIFISTYDVSVKRCGILNEYCSCKYLCSLSVRIFQRIIFIITANSLDDRRRLGKNTLLQAAPARLQVCHPGEGGNENLQWFYTLNINWHLRLTLLSHKIFREDLLAPTSRWKPLLTYSPNIVIREISLTPWMWI